LSKTDVFSLYILSKGLYTTTTTTTSMTTNQEDKQKQLDDDFREWMTIILILTFGLPALVFLYIFIFEVLL
jgi:hypothetical protein